jgi:integrase
MYARMEKHEDSASERHKTGKLLRQALRHAVNLGLLAANPASKIPLPKVVKEEIHPLDAPQSHLFLERAAEDRLYAMYAVALDSGMRQGELFGLAWPDLNFETGSVQVQRSLEEIKGHLRLKELKTKAARRRIRLSGFALDALHEHRKRMLAEGRNVKDGPVFCDTEGKRLRKSNVQRRSFDRIVSKAALPENTRFHDLRHTCATLLLLADVNAKVVSERLGHSKIQITLDTYSHVLPTMQEKAADALNGIFRNNFRCTSAASS